MEETYNIASLMELARIESYNKFTKEKLDGSTKEKDFISILNNYFQKIINYKLGDGTSIKDKVTILSRSIVEHITGDYQIGIAESTFEELNENTEIFSNIIAYSNSDKLKNILKQNQEKDLANVLVDGAIDLDFVQYSENKVIKEQAKKNLNSSKENVKKFFEEAIYNILHINEKVANVIAHLTGMDNNEKEQSNKKTMLKFMGGIGYELLSGTLIDKRHFTPVQNSESMINKIREEGILHFSSPTAVEKIIKSGKVKKSNFLDSDLTARKSFFFGGVPTFDDLLINIPAYDVMTAVRIRPTEEQMKELKYRAINDRAVVKDGDFNFESNQAEIAYFGLMYDKEKNSIYLGELNKEQAENFEVSKEVKNLYHYNIGKNSIMSNVKMNLLGFCAEYRHHQKLLALKNKMKEKGIKSYSELDDKTLVELSDIREAYISTKDRSVERKNIFEKIKQKIEQTKNKSKSEKTEEKEDESYGKDIY